MAHAFANSLTLFMYGLLYLWTTSGILIFIPASFCAPRIFLDFLIQLWARGIIVLIGGRLQVVGREYIPTSRKYMILTNHASLFDIPVIMAVFPHVSWLGRDYLTRIPLFAHILKRTNYVAIRRNPAADVRLIIQKSILNTEKFVIAIFPEGTRTTTGQLQEFKRGFIHIMNGGDLDILPIILNGLFQIKPKTRFSIRPFQKIEMIISKPIKRSSLIDLSNEEIIARVREVFIANYKSGKGEL
ncbi:1-acyl-sn-glycerol-3-phosphate acyltransferase [candidate division KSB1 bacterium]|nr:1-acyl-sn-glycerol-3-phosphate acyltransferase [candidate division KSB1 bacterium]